MTWVSSPAKLEMSVQISEWGFQSAQHLVA
jgi:hypothetical protein